MQRETRYQTGEIYKESDLKICDLCGGLNLVGNQECFVCGWRGRFETRPQIVRIAMDLVIGRCGELKPELVADAGQCRKTLAPTFAGQMRRLALRIKQWLFA